MLTSVSSEFKVILSVFVYYCQLLVHVTGIDFRGVLAVIYELKHQNIKEAKTLLLHFIIPIFVI